jgi:hypothetical protein
VSDRHYDRSELIQRSIDNVKETLVEIILTVVFIIMLFLWHVPSAMIPVLTIPFALFLSFIPFSMMGITANIMSLGGIAIAMGELVDAAIVVVEQTHKKLEAWQKTGQKEDYRDVVISAIKEVAGPSFYTLLVIGVSFLPVLALERRPPVQAAGLPRSSPCSLPPGWPLLWIPPCEFPSRASRNSTSGLNGSAERRTPYWWGPSIRKRNIR